MAAKAGKTFAMTSHDTSPPPASLPPVIGSSSSRGSAAAADAIRSIRWTLPEHGRGGGAAVMAAGFNVIIAPDGDGKGRGDGFGRGIAVIV